MRDAIQSTMIFPRINSIVGEEISNKIFSLVFNRTKDLEENLETMFTEIQALINSSEKNKILLGFWMSFIIFQSYEEKSYRKIFNFIKQKLSSMSLTDEREKYVFLICLRKIHQLYQNKKLLSSENTSEYAKLISDAFKKLFSKSNHFEFSNESIYYKQSIMSYFLGILKEIAISNITFLKPYIAKIQNICCNKIDFLDKENVNFSVQLITELSTGIKHNKEKDYFYNILSKTVFTILTYFDAQLPRTVTEEKQAINDVKEILISSLINSTESGACLKTENDLHYSLLILRYLFKILNNLFLPKVESHSFFSMSTLLKSFNTILEFMIDGENSKHHSMKGMEFNMFTIFLEKIKCYVIKFITNLVKFQSNLLWGSIRDISFIINNLISLYPINKISPIQICSLKLYAECIKSFRCSFHEILSKLLFPNNTQNNIFEIGLKAAFLIFQNYDKSVISHSLKIIKASELSKKNKKNIENRKEIIIFEYQEKFFINLLKLLDIVISNVWPLIPVEKLAKMEAFLIQILTGSHLNIIKVLPQNDWKIILKAVRSFLISGISKYCSPKLLIEILHFINISKSIRTDQSEKIFLEKISDLLLLQKRNESQATNNEFSQYWEIVYQNCKSMIEEFKEGLNKSASKYNEIKGIDFSIQTIIEEQKIKVIESPNRKINESSQVIDACQNNVHKINPPNIEKLIEQINDHSAYEKINSPKPEEEFDENNILKYINLHEEENFPKLGIFNTSLNKK